MNVMKPIMNDTIPRGGDWVYETKYDGFRCLLKWEKDSIRLISKNGTDLTATFPEIPSACQTEQSLIGARLPLTLDGELAILNNAHQSNFSLLQQRGRMTNTDRIAAAASERPVSFMAFDVLLEAGESLLEEPLQQRKQRLRKLFNDKSQLGQRLYAVPFSSDADAAWENAFRYKGEGVVAKRQTSVYKQGKDHRDWFKIKNWRTVTAFLTFYHTQNDYFTACVFHDGKPVDIGKCKHGLDESASDTLRQLFVTNGTKEIDGYRLPPAVCASIHTLDLVSDEIREPSFSQLLPDMDAADCTVEKLNLDMAMLPETVEATNTAKVFWPSVGVTKGDMLAYMREVTPYMLPFLQDRMLTIIRCPDGVDGESFFQKHRPDGAPDFVKGVEHDGDMHFVCNNLESLVWLANHGTMEYHIPFQPSDRTQPVEIVFDLDPPGREAFHLAVKAAKLLKQLLDNLDLISFVKTSGGKGLQVHIPIPPGTMSYADTGIFTQAIAWTLEREYPKAFTTERMKEKRGNRLYIDYLQHGEGKTIVAPYSPRKRKDATVAAPLFWEEVNDDLSPDMFTVANVIDRVQTNGCPFAPYFTTKQQQPIDKIINMTRE
ncbi:DNA ligase D [Lentibacillus halophilus]|uniref:DNA ligase (ATP) n=1 Tax=Lentibacillus halophilus TaxID=295065 RepID=A0ABN0Z7E1_9BACI